MQSKLTGLIAATFTPMEADGALRLDQIEPLVERLLMDGVSGFYVCGTTGEGMSLTGAERRAVVEAHMAAVDGRAPVVVQVGHNSVAAPPPCPPRPRHTSRSQRRPGCSGAWRPSRQPLPICRFITTISRC